MSSEDKLDFESANHSIVSANAQDRGYMAALRVARELNTAPPRTINLFSTLRQAVQRFTPVMAVGAAGIVAAGIAAALNSSRRARSVERRAGDHTDTGLQIVLVSQIVVYRRRSIRLEIFDRRDDVAGKRF